jgi:hypothetical protein
MHLRLSAPSRLRRRALAWLPALVVVAAALLPASALAAGAHKLVSYRGYRLVVPSNWPVYRLGADGAQCVRFDRHAVYLGRPGGNQRCPAQAAGRTEAILVQPLTAGGGPAGQPLPATGAARSGAGPGTEAQIVNTAHRVLVTATWNRAPAVIQRALGLGSLTAAAATAARRRPGSAVGQVSARVRTDARARTAVAASAPSAPGQIYTGPGFDACTTPSPSQMSAWDASPYRAIGVYIGGTNAACSQPNLSADWVTTESVDGWHMIPIYVGLQAPGNSCGCASISPSAAATQGTAAAQDAAADAQAIGLGAGNPLYFDMEAYNRGTSTTSAVLTFLSAWTAELHALGYQSGVYSSDASGITDLVAQDGTGYAEPDDIWIANWNGAQTTTDPDVPAAEWPDHQRLHQYQGAHNETYSGVKINIDGDYLDSATAAAGTGSGVAATPAPAAAPAVKVTAGLDGSVNLTPSWLYATGIASWRILGGADPTALTWTGPTVAAAAHLPIVTRNAFPYYAVQALDSTGQTLGTSIPVPDPQHVAIFGSSVFVPRRGLGGVPVACFSVSPCTLTTTIYVGRTTLATTGFEHLTTSQGLTFFKLNARGQSLLARAAHHRMAVKIKVADKAGHKVTRPLTLASFATADPNPPRSAGASPAVRFIGMTEFVSHGWVGGVLAACVATTPCNTTMKIVSGGKVIATTKPEALGAGEVGYLFFSLTSAGHKLLAHTKGNQLAATVTVTSATVAGAPGTTSAGSGSGAGSGGTGLPGSATAGTTGAAVASSATAHIALVSFQ